MAISTSLLERKIEDFLLHSNPRLTRRNFLKAAWGITLGAVAAGGLGGLLGFYRPPRVRAGTLTGIARGRLMGQEHGLHQAGEAFVSPVEESLFPFNALGAQWEGGLRLGEDFYLEVKTSWDGVNWSPWLSLEELDGLRGGRVEASDLIFSSGRFFQYRVTPVKGSLERVRFTYIDSTPGPSMYQARASSNGVGRIAALVRPPVIARSGWGASESYRFYRNAEVWPPEYAPIEKVIVHHTATIDDDQDPAAVMRAIYYYHAVTRGWGDIGYNFIIDRYGNVYEGRYGGPNVVGAHVAGFNRGSIGVAIIGNYSNTEAPQKALESLATFLTYKAVQHGVAPGGRGIFSGKELPNIAGHRDCVTTACPGDRLYAYLPQLRSNVVASMPALGQAWLGHQTPSILAPGAKISVPITLRNSGTASWTTTKPNPFRLGFKWLLPDGKEYTAESELEYHTDLPRDTAPGETVTIQASLRAPKGPGQYVLRWDMVQERVAWFYQQGNPTLDVPVSIPAYTSIFIPSIQKKSKGQQSPGGSVAP